MIFAGIDPSYISIIRHGYNDLDREYKVIKSISEDDALIIAYVEKDSFGLWKVNQIEKTSEDNSMVSIAWFENSGHQFYDSNEFITNHEIHIIYAGNNATQSIVLNNESASNISLKVDQSNNYYTIELIGIGNLNDVNKFSIESILDEIN